MIQHCKIIRFGWQKYVSSLLFCSSKNRRVLLTNSQCSFDSNEHKHEESIFAIIFHFHGKVSSMQSVYLDLQTAGTFAEGNFLNHVSVKRHRNPKNCKTLFSFQVTVRVAHIRMC